MTLVEWRKEGRDVVLPGDDPHISVQSRGGPLKFEHSSWLQIAALLVTTWGPCPPPLCSEYWKQRSCRPTWPTACRR
ncbi:kazal-type serine protease inhibitor domain-containing protein 1-like [Dicentrarchus labrax]|uniref:kazal-type serine protease inhibitor domain-containing protein 1-like n=1 Tax=Dicentrarchus labrax TaxID=13489 RepID=UPI0021F54B19|nr:kazal-type serine protease inhibitor domain-containing protein 1-like [Dicentrarchus labrax]